MRRLLVCLLLSACSSPAADPQPDATSAEASGLEVFERHATELALHWQPGSASRYFLSFAKGTTAPASCVPGPSTLDVMGRSTATVSGLDASSDYAFRLCGVDDRGGTLVIGAGITAADRTLALPPGEVTMFALVGDTGVLIAGWGAAAGATSYALAYAEGLTAPATCAGGQITTDTHYTFTGLATNKMYAVRVCARNDNPQPDVSAGATATAFLHSAVILDPTNLTLELHDSWVKLAWTGTAPAYKVVLDPTNAAPSCTGAGETTTRSSIVLSLAVGTLYHLRICSSNGDTQPIYSTGLTNTFTTPQLVEPHVNALSCVNSGGIDLTWRGPGTSSPNYYMTNASTSLATTAPLCSATATHINPSHNSSGYDYGFPFGTGHGESFWVRICYYDGVYDQGEVINLRTPDVSGSAVIPGSCTQGEALPLPTMSLQSGQVTNGQVALSGTCAVGATLHLDGNIAAQLLACTTGTWSTTGVVTAIGPGTIRIVATPWIDTRYEGQTNVATLVAP